MGYWGRAGTRLTWGMAGAVYFVTTGAVYLLTGAGTEYFVIVGGAEYLLAGAEYLLGDAVMPFPVCLR